MKRKKLRAHSIESLESRRLFTVYTVTSVADTGAGTLRQAILDSNANTGADTINFNLVGAANVPPPIKPAGNLPSITDALTIDGTSQPGYAGKPIVVLSGDLIPTSPIATYGLQVSASNVTIKGLDIVGFKGAGISIAAVSGVQVQGNYIGIDTDGVTAHGNVTGINANGYNNTIGGTTAAARNVISGNTTGIALTGSLNNGVAVQGNYIGTNAAGTAAVGNVTGVAFSITLGTIGGSAAAQNIISGNTGAGVNAADLSSTTGNNFATVSYNLIGVSATGGALGNGGAGVQSGGPVNAALNLYVTNNEIANNAGAGVLVQGNSLVHTLIENNSIHDNTGQGIDVSGAPNSTSIPPAPVIWGIAGSSYRAEIKVAAAASRTYTIDLYASNTAYPFTKGEGKTLVGSALILTDSSGVSDTYVMITGPVSPGQVLTATLTDGSATTTSTFSNGVFLGNPSITAAVADVTGGGYALVSRTVYLDTNNNGVLDSGETSVQTSSTGSVSFGSVGSGTYYVRTVLPAGAAQYYPADDSAFVVDAEPGTTNSVFFYTRSVGLTPNMGGPYSVAEGASTTLDASKSTITTGTISKYEWDLNYDNTAFNVDATGATATFSAASLDGPSTRTVALRLTDAQGDATIVTTKVTITNANPTATFKGDTAAFGTPSFVTFTGASDPAPADSTAGFKYSYDFNNDGDFADTGDVANSTSSIASFTYATAGSHTIHGRITDKDGGFTDYTMTVSVTATAAVPTSNPGGPYTVAEGKSITLNGSGSTAAGGATITKYEWDLNWDGTNFTADATGASPTFSAASLDGPSTRVVGLRVTDSNGQVSAINKVVVSITNVAPTAQLSGGEDYTNQPSPVFFQFAVDSPADVSAGFKYSYDFNNDGDFVDAGDVANSTLASASYTFTTAGSYTVHGRITDKDGAFTDYTTTLTEIDMALPGPVNNFQGTWFSSTGIVDIGWGSIEGAAGVEIQRATNSSFTSPTTLDTGTLPATAEEYQDTTAVAGNIYYYRMRGTNHAGAGPWSNTITVSTATTAPSAPTNLAVTPNSGVQVTIGWTDTSSNEAGFEVQRSASSTFSSPTTFTTAANRTSYVDTTTAPNTYYYYRVRAVNGPLASAYTKSIKIKTLKTGAVTAPTAPNGLGGTANSSSQLTLKWTDNSSTETGFELQRSTSSTFTSPTTITLGANVTSYADTGLAAGTTYYYRVRATNSAGPSAYSTTFALATLVGGVTVNAPSNLKAVANSATQVALTWTDTATNETGFQVQRATSSSFTSPTTFTLNTANTQNYTDSTAVANTTYYYRVLAFSGATNSSYSTTVTVTTPASSGGATSVQATPTNFAAVAQAGGQVKLTWTDTAATETGYEIQVSTVYNFATIVQDVVVPTANLSTYTVTGLSKNTYYYFRVRAITTPANFDSNYTGSIKLKTLTT